MDRHECRVISDATSVHPLCRSRVDLSIIGLVAEEVEEEVAVGGVESVQPLCRSRVNLSIIGLVAEEVEVEVAVGGVEEDLRNL